MKKTTSLKLSKQLAKYGALTAAIIGVADASGQSIIHNDISDFIGGTGDTFLLDINNDGVNDFQITHNFYSSSYYSSSYRNLRMKPLTASNSILGSGANGDNYVYPFALAHGDDISSAATGTWLNQGFAGGYQSLNYSSCSDGLWCNITDGYLGLRFNISGNIHYGWARLDVSQSGDVWIVKDFAYHDTPGVGLTAGQETLSVDLSALNNIKIVALNKSIGLYNLPEATTYRLVSMTGKQVLDGTTSGSSFVVEANTLATGIYIIELTDSDSKSVIRKKIVL